MDTYIFYIFYIKKYFIYKIILFLLVLARNPVTELFDKLKNINK